MTLPLPRLRASTNRARAVEEHGKNQHPHLNRGLVLAERVQGGGLASRNSIPDVENVVVTPAGEVPSTRRPLETTDLLCVRSERGHVVPLNAHVMVMDCTRPTPANQTQQTSCKAM